MSWLRSKNKINLCQNSTVNVLQTKKQDFSWAQTRCNKFGESRCFLVACIISMAWYRLIEITHLTKQIQAYFWTSSHISIVDWDIWSTNILSFFQILWLNLSWLLSFVGSNAVHLPNHLPCPPPQPQTLQLSAGNNQNRYDKIVLYNLLKVLCFISFEV